MSISINWGTKVIYVPKADLELIQANPEIRELDLDWFRLMLKDLEDDSEGMPFPDTHNHVTETLLAGVTYARIVEIINGYTVEFEDGQYTVNCVGANHNLSDVKVVNQVSLIVNNTAGMITNPAIERILGLSKENIGIDQTQYDNDGNLTSARVRTHTAAPIGDGNVLATYLVTATFSNGRLATFKQEKQ